MGANIVLEQPKKVDCHLLILDFYYFIYVYLHSIVSMYNGLWHSLLNRNLLHSGSEMIRTTLSCDLHPNLCDDVA